MKKRICCDCGKEFYGASNAKRCPACREIREHRRLPPSEVDDLMLEWSLDEDFWLRRIAIDHQLGRKEKTNTELLEKILVNNLGSREFFINKAIGWSLRDYSKTDPEWVRDFIRTYGEKMDKLSVREGSKYL